MIFQLLFNASNKKISLEQNFPCLQKKIGVNYVATYLEEGNKNFKLTNYVDIIQFW